MRQRRRLHEDTIHSESDSETLIDRARRLGSLHQIDLGKGPKLYNVESPTPQKTRHAHRVPSEPCKGKASRGVTSHGAHGEARSRHLLRRQAASQPHASVEELRRRSLARAREACGEGPTEGECPAGPRKELYVHA